MPEKQNRHPVLSSSGACVPSHPPGASPTAPGQRGRLRLVGAALLGSGHPAGLPRGERPVLSHDHVGCSGAPAGDVDRGPGHDRTRPARCVAGPGPPARRGPLARRVHCTPAGGAHRSHRAGSAAHASTWSTSRMAEGHRIRDAAGVSFRTGSEDPGPSRPAGSTGGERLTSEDKSC